MAARPPPAPIRLLIVDDHDILRYGIRSLLRRTSEVEVVGGQPRGVAVHAAARVAALATAGEVLVSATTRDLLDGSGLAFDDRGAHELKGLTGSRGIFALVRG